jgi:hypothetical protein
LAAQVQAGKPTARAMATVRGYGRLVKLNAFACRDGYVLSNECMLAPRAAEDAHGAMSALLGIVDCHELPPPLCAAVIDSVYRDHYAFVPIALALDAKLKIHPAALPRTGQAL